MKPVYTCRVTVLEAFRSFLYCYDEETTPWLNEDNVITSVKGIETYNVKAAFGSAGHSIIENPLAYRRNLAPDPNEFQTIASGADVMPEHEPIWGYQVKDFTFTDTQAAPLLKFRSEHPLMVREIPLSKLYTTPEFDLIVTGTCDHMEGNVMRDTKFKFSNFDMADYLDSCQYKFYLDMAGMKSFYYDFFRVFGFESMADMGKARIGECESLPVHAYMGMEDDLQSILYEFSDWIKFKNLQEYLSITPAKAKKIVQGNPELKSLIMI